VELACELASIRGVEPCQIGENEVSDLGNGIAGCNEFEVEPTELHTQIPDQLGLSRSCRDQPATRHGTPEVGNPGAVKCPTKLENPPRGVWAARPSQPRQCVKHERRIT
jgi:hypothetical protein